MDLPFGLAEPRALVLLLTIAPVIYLGALAARARPRERHRVFVSIVVRSVVLLLLTLAVAGIHWISSGGPLSVVFLLDESASVSPTARQMARDYVKQAVESMSGDEQAAVVRFGANAVVDRAVGSSPGWEPGLIAPSHLATNVADAIQTGLALFPEGGSRRLVLISDGLETTGEAHRLLAQYRADGVELSVLPLEAASDNDASIERVASPASVPAGQEFQVKVAMVSTSARTVTVRLFDGDQPVAEQTVDMAAGRTVVDFTVPARSQGFRALRAELSSVDDRFAENNVMRSFTVVRSPPNVLIVATDSADSEPLEKALLASGISVRVSSPEGMPVGLDGLVEFDAVVVANVSADRLGADRQALLQTFVRDLGHGLVMLGGEVSYGAGGYLRSTLEQVLPVSMDVRTSEQRASIAISFVVDKSGSMGRCHCGGSQTFDPTMRTEFGPSKVEIAKQAIARAAGLLNSTDQVGVVGFDEAAHTLVALQSLKALGADGLAKALKPVEAAGGPTHIYAGVEAGIAQLRSTDAGLKHMILISDGWTQQADFSGLLAEIAANKATLTTVGAGEGPGEELKMLAERGGGRYYAATDIYGLPDILLKETVKLAGQYYIEGQFRAIGGKESSIMSGFDPTALPPLLGYNSATMKPSAEGVLLSPAGDPILAQWQYGLGRSVAWTPDMKGRWASNWVEWPEFSKFAGQLVQWTAPSSGSPGVVASYHMEPYGSQGAQRASVTIESRDFTGNPRNGLVTTLAMTDTTGASVSTRLTQTSPGVYVADVTGLTEGVYATELQQREPGSEDLVVRDLGGLAVPYSNEFAVAPGAGVRGRAYLAELAQLGGGTLLAPGDTSSIWAHNLRSQPVRVPLWPWLLLAAIFLFPLDVAIRRLSLNLSSLRRGKEEPSDGSRRAQKV